MIDGFTFVSDVRFRRVGHGASRRIIPASDAPQECSAAGRLPRLARLMALAIRFDGLVRDGTVTDYAQLARLGYVTRARITQILNLTLLAPSIQEEILFLPPIERGRDPYPLRALQPIALTADWREQRRLWKLLLEGIPPLSVFMEDHR